MKAQVFSEFGKILLKAGQVFSDTVIKKKRAIESAGGSVSNIVLSPAERTEALSKGGVNMEQTFYRIEKRFREAVVKTGIYGPDNPIQATYLHPPCGKGG